MAALNDRDLRAILGDDYMLKIAEANEASGLSVDVREARKEHQALEEKKFAGVSALAVSLALIAAGLYTREPSFWIQITAALLIGAVGAGWLIYIRKLQGGLITD